MVKLNREFICRSSAHGPSLSILHSCWITSSGAFDARDISSRILVRWKQHTNFRAGVAQLSWLFSRIEIGDCINMGNISVRWSTITVYIYIEIIIKIVWGVVYFWVCHNPIQHLEIPIVRFAVVLSYTKYHFSYYHNRRYMVLYASLTNI